MTNDVELRRLMTLQRRYQQATDQLFDAGCRRSADAVYELGLATGKRIADRVRVLTAAYRKPTAVEVVS